MELVDTHCHLQFDSYKNNEDRILARASADGVKKIICVGTTLNDSDLALQLAQSKKTVWAAVGVHPHDASGIVGDPKAIKKLSNLARNSKVVAVGETGLDYYRQHSGKDEQKELLKAHIEVAQELNMPLIFHVRDAWEDFWPIFDSYKNIRGVVHSFSAHQAELDEILKRDLYVGLNGIMTFTKDEMQLAAAKNLPLDKLMLETDAPFLTPAPFRGELCEPKHARTVADFLARLRNERLEELASATTANANNLFKMGEKR